MSDGLVISFFESPSKKEYFQNKHYTKSMDICIAKKDF